MYLLSCESEHGCMEIASRIPHGVPETGNILLCRVLIISAMSALREMTSLLI